MKIPTECVKCGLAGGPAIEVDEDFAGWLCPNCMKKMEVPTQPETCERADDNHGSVVDQACIVFTLFEDKHIVLRTLDGNDQDLNKMAEVVAQLAKAVCDHEPLPPDPACELAAAKRDVEALQKFKAYVHQRLDAGGVPANPEPPNHALHGCRIGDRIDWVFNQIAEKEAEAGRLRDVLGRMRKWDHLPTAADGPYWITEIETALSPTTKESTDVRT